MENTNNKLNMYESNIPAKKSMLDDETKQSIKQNMNIDVDSEVFSPMVAYTFKRICTADTEPILKHLMFSKYLSPYYSNHR